MVVAQDVSELQFRANLICVRSAANAQPLVRSSGDQASVPDVVPADPLAVLVHQIWELAVRLDDGFQRAGNVRAMPPAKSVRGVGEKRDLEPVFPAAFNLDGLVLRIAANLAAVHLDAVKFHDVEGRIRVTRAEPVNARCLDLQEASGNLNATTRKRCRPDAAIHRQLFRHERRHFVIIDVRRVLPGIDGNRGVRDVGPASSASADLPDTHHVGLPGEDVDLHGLPGRVAIRAPLGSLTLAAGKGGECKARDEPRSKNCVINLAAFH